MAADITSIFLEAVQAIFGGIADGITDLFTTLIWVTVETEPGVYVSSLTDLATWMIVFMGVSFSLTIFYALFRKVA